MLKSWQTAFLTFDWELKNLRNKLRFVFMNMTCLLLDCVQSFFSYYYSVHFLPHGG